MQSTLPRNLCRRLPTSAIAGPSRLGPLEFSRFHSSSSTATPPTSNRASHAYHQPGHTSEATSSTPNLTPSQRDLLNKIIRVDQAGESAANWIYQATKVAVALKNDKRTVKDVEEMWETERHHLKTLDRLQAQHRVRPTVLAPVWKALSWTLGGATGLMSREAIMAATEAVETVIGEHYDEQIEELQQVITALEASGETPHPSLPLLHKILHEFRDDELEHLDTAVENGAQMAPGHALLSAVVEGGCRAAIWTAGKI